MSLYSSWNKLQLIYLTIKIIPELLNKGKNVDPAKSLFNVKIKNLSVDITQGMSVATDTVTQCEQRNQYD